MERSQRSVVVWDLGGVLSAEGDLIERLARTAGAGVDEFAARYWRHRADYDLGGTAQDYWQQVVGSTPISPELLADLSAIDEQTWSAVRPAALAVLESLSDTRLALLSNLPRESARAVAAAPWSGCFERRYFSCDLALTKPDPRIYAQVSDDLGVASSEIVFFDDRSDNVDAARACGWDAHVWRSDAETIDILERAGLR